MIHKKRNKQTNLHPRAKSVWNESAVKITSLFIFNLLFLFCWLVFVFCFLKHITPHIVSYETSPNLTLDWNKKKNNTGCKSSPFSFFFFFKAISWGWLSIHPIQSWVNYCPPAKNLLSWVTWISFGAVELETSFCSTSIISRLWAGKRSAQVKNSATTTTC